MRELSEDGRTRLLRRYRKLDGEGRAVAKRMWEHAMAVEWDRQWVQRDLASAKRWGEELVVETQRLRERCSALYQALTPEQRELMRTNEG